MRKAWSFTVSGHGSGGYVFTTSGAVYCELHDVFNRAMKDCFDQLTHGRAVYGNPGMGCHGPYEVTRLLIERKPEPEVQQ